jgi:uncharacterized SAM-binding protein YcdF (DUF218 family)
MIILVIALILVFIVIAFAVGNPWDKLYNYLVVDEQPQAADAIIALGGGSGRDIYAAELYKSGLSSKVIVSVLQPSSARMAKIVRKQGVKREDIIMEERAMNTYQNALFTREIMIANGYQSAIIVSSPSHMRRTKMIFDRLYKDTGISLTYCPVPLRLDVDSQERGIYTKQSLILEYVKLLFYWIWYK